MGRSSQVDNVCGRADADADADAGTYYTSRPTEDFVTDCRPVSPLLFAEALFRLVAKLFQPWPAQLLGLLRQASGPFGRLGKILLGRQRVVLERRPAVGDKVFRWSGGVVGTGVGVSISCFSRSSSILALSSSS